MRSWRQGVKSDVLGMRSTASQTLATTWSSRPTSPVGGSSLYCDEPAAMMMACGDGGGTATSSDDSSTVPVTLSRNLAVGSGGARLREHEHHKQATTTNATVDVSPGECQATSGCIDPLARENDDDDDGVSAEGRKVTSDRPSRARGGKAAAAGQTLATAGDDASEGRGIRDLNQDNAQEDEENTTAGVNRLSLSPSSYSCTPSSPLAGLEDLPDGVIARALCSGFLDSLEVAFALRTVSRRFQAIGRSACQVCSAFAHGPCDAPKSTDSCAQLGFLSATLG